MATQSRSTARRRPTIEDVARAAGVSRGTVSRVLNGGHHVSASALAAVERAVRETGYTANPYARSLVTQRANSVAFVLSEPQDRLFDDPNVSTILRACTQALGEVDLPLLLMVAGSDDERQRVSRFLSGGHADGVLLISARAGDPLMDLLVGIGIPVVACGKPLGHEFDIPYAAGDDRRGGQLAVRRLRELGRERIATISGPLDTPGGIDRLAGYHDVLGDDVDPALVATGDFSRAGGERAMSELLERAPDLDAVFVCSDVAALGAMHVLRRSGRRIPDDVAVIGYDDSQVAASADPPLTTVRQPFARIATEMVRLLRDAMGGSEPAASLLPCQLVAREST